MTDRKNLEEVISKKTDNFAEIADAIIGLVRAFDKDILVWLGELFDADIGGFYYSKSARNGERYMPDIESTYQAIGIMRLLGVIDSYDNIPIWMRKGISGFICSCENECNGLFYQNFEDNIEEREISSRFGRNFYYATRLAEALKISLPFPTVIDRVKKGEKIETYHMFYDKKEFVVYLEESIKKNGILRTLNLLNAQKHNIIAYGRESEVISYLDSIRDEATGLYGSKVDVSAINVLNSALNLYNDLGYPFKNYSKSLDVLLENICSYTPININHNENIWGAIWRIKLNVIMFQNSKSKEAFDRFMDRIYELAPSALKHLTQMLLKYKRSDGSFSYTVEGSSEYSSGIKAADKNMCEGDVNATVIALYTLKESLNVLDVDPGLIRPFSRADFDLFLASIPN